MRYLIRAGGAEGCAWVAARTGIACTPRARSVVACRRDNLIRAAVVLDGWTQTSARVHAACESPVAWRALAPEVLRYAFRDARMPSGSGVAVLLAEVRSDNLPALRGAEHAGFEFEHRVKGVFGVGCDLILLALRRETWENSAEPDRMVA